MTSNRWTAAFVIVVGVILLAAAITYFTVKAQSLPSFMGFIAGSDVIRWKRGLASLLLALVCLVFGVARATRR